MTLTIASRRQAARRRARRDADLDEPGRPRRVVAEAPLGDAGARSSTPAAAAREAQRGWAATPAPVRGRVIEQIGRLVEANAEALARLVTREIGKPLRRGAAARCRRSSTPARSSSARAGGCTGRPCPARCRTSSCSPSASRSAWPRSSPPATSRSRCRPGTSCRRCCAATPWCGSRPSTRRPSPRRSPSCSSRGGLPDGVLNTVLADGPATFDGLTAALEAGLVDKVGFTGSSAVGRADRRAGRAAPAEPVPGAGRQEPAGRDARRRPRPGRRGRAVLRLRHRRAALHLAGHGASCTRRVHDEFLRALRRRGARRAVIGDPTRDDVLYGPMISARFLRALREAPGPGRRRTTPLHGSTGTGRITADNPRDGLRRRRRGRAVRPPDDRRRGARRRRDLPHRDVRADRRRGAVRHLRRGGRAGQRPRLRAVRGDLHERPRCTRSGSASGSAPAWSA